MRRIAVEELSTEAFSPFGTYLDPSDCGSALGAHSDREPVRFYPDRILLLFEHSNIVSISPLALDPRTVVVTVTEIHAHTEEAFGGFTKDVVFHVGPRKLAGATEPDLDRFRAFRLPAGWWVRLGRGVWHHAPFVLGHEATVGIVILPPATYTADCHVVNLEEGIAIDV